MGNLEYTAILATLRHLFNANVLDEELTNLAGQSALREHPGDGLEAAPPKILKGVKLLRKIMREPWGSAWGPEPSEGPAMRDV